APGSMLAGGAGGPAGLNISVGVKKQTDDIYAVEITLNAKAEREKTVLFNVELVYGGVFRVKNVPEAQMPLLLMVEGPRLIFPFARQVLANITQQGGFAPLMIEPVDFLRLYQQNLATLTAAKEAGSTDKPN
ncbi:MAG: protein-export chaperone SecB, partial [Hyphomicrobiales bacterium]